jgi:chromosome segregation ATPase
VLNPLALPNDVIAALRSVANIERILDERLRGLERRFDSLDARMARLPEDIEQTLRRHFEGQRADLSALHEELVANREHAELLPGKVDGLRDELKALLAELTEVRETVEPLQGPAERAARLSERLPGGASPYS